MRIRDKSAAGRKKYRMMVIAVLLATVALSMSAFAGQWRQDDTGWWYQNEDGTYVKSEWSWIDGRCYYFNEDGYCLQNTQTPDGYSVDGQGAWIEGGVVQMQQEVQAQMQQGGQAQRCSPPRSLHASPGAPGGASVCLMRTAAPRRWGPGHPSGIRNTQVTPRRGRSTLLGSLPPLPYPPFP